MKKFTRIFKIILFLLFTIIPQDSDQLFFRKKVIYQMVHDPLQVKSDTITIDNLFGWLNPKNYIKFKLWTRLNPILAQEIKVGNLESLNTSNFNTSKPTKVIVHGFAHSANEIFLEDWIILLRDNYLKVADVNDYTLFALPHLYFLSGTNLATNCLADMIQFLVGNGAKLQDFHLIGYSWGSHVAGNAGHKVFRILGKKIQRVTGLDPGLPFYKYVEDDDRLSENDADFVDIIHTNCGGSFMEGFLGLDKGTAHIHFYPNGGKSQPGCPIHWAHLYETMECYHSRSVYLFIESIISPMAFPSCLCSDWDTFFKGDCNCDKANLTFMGEHASQKARGKYYLFTKGESPFGKHFLTNNTEMSFDEEIEKMNQVYETLDEIENEINQTRTDFSSSSLNNSLINLRDLLEIHDINIIDDEENMINGNVSYKNQKSSEF